MAACLVRSRGDVMVDDFPLQEKLEVFASSCLDGIQSEKRGLSCSIEKLCSLKLVLLGVLFICFRFAFRHLEIWRWSGPSVLLSRLPSSLK